VASAELNVKCVLNVKRNGAAALGLLVGLASGGPVFAQAAPSAAVKAVLACRHIEDKAQQLDCFLSTTKTLEQESPSPKVVAEEKPRPFGLPRAPVRKVKAPEVKQVKLTLTSLSDAGDGRMIFTFDDGSTWRELEPDSVAGALKPGQAVMIERGMLGSYLLDVPGRATVRVKRDRGT
jgi:hypothetical protein